MCAMGKLLNEKVVAFPKALNIIVAFHTDMIRVTEKGKEHKYYAFNVEVLPADYETK